MVEDNELINKINKLELKHKQILDRIEYLNTCQQTRARIKHLKRLHEKKSIIFNNLRFKVIHAVEAGYKQEWNTGRWYK